MAAADLKRALMAFYGLYAALPVLERYLLATAEDLPHACEEL